MGFDHWLREKEDDFYQHPARLEVAGMQRGLERVNARLESKLRQTAQFKETGLTAIGVVAEFRQPLAVMRR
jgi:hypothetical protein